LFVIIPVIMNDVTRILDACSAEAPGAEEQLLPLVYEELRRLAAARMANEMPGQTLQATALVHEAWIRLLGPDGNEQAWDNRAHFFGAAAEAMRRILIDRARKRKRVKHGGKLERINLDGIDVAETTAGDVLLKVDEAIAKLVQEDPQAVELIKLRFFVGLEMAEIAKTMELSERAAYRIWAFARAWLYKELSPKEAASE
jgi:RNA polymerase sigma factor (TIGR02999 family)